MLHAGLGERLGPAAAWADTCTPGDPVGLVDEGIGFAPPAALGRVELVGDETALPAIAGILADLPGDMVGCARIEVPAAEDRRELPRPVGVEVEYLVRNSDRMPGLAIAEQVLGRSLPAESCFGWVAGEAGLVGAVRRHWVTLGAPRDRVAFCGYWRAGRSH